MKYAYEFGYTTSISIEPMLDNKVDQLVELIRQYVTEAIWIGKMNDVRKRMGINGDKTAQDIEAANKIIEEQDDTAILKIYETYQDDPMIRWKDSIREVVKSYIN